jgi:hypothetical protein
MAKGEVNQANKTVFGMPVSSCLCALCSGLGLFHHPSHPTIITNDLVWFPGYCKVMATGLR